MFIAFPPLFFLGNPVPVMPTPPPATQSPLVNGCPGEKTLTLM